ncbi:MAG: hypothetical protein AVDCRST_MAG49-2508, partial [uncultured Thermomicrobiales bacterium]
ALLLCLYLVPRDDPRPGGRAACPTARRWGEPPRADPGLVQPRRGRLRLPTCRLRRPAGANGVPPALHGPDELGRAGGHREPVRHPDRGSPPGGPAGDL